jgi:hypothetical protein
VGVIVSQQASGGWWRRGLQLLVHDAARARRGLTPAAHPPHLELKARPELLLPLPQQALKRAAACQVGAHGEHVLQPEQLLRAGRLLLLLCGVVCGVGVAWRGDKQGGSIAGETVAPAASAHHSAEHACTPPAHTSRNLVHSPAAARLAAPILRRLLLLSSCCIACG